MLSIEKERPGSFSKKNITFNKDILEKTKTISHESINRQITQLNTEFISAIECFRRSISLENIQRIADALGVEAYRLLLENQEGTENDK